MANAWPDFPNQYGTNYYSDFMEWMKNTLEFAKKIKLYLDNKTTPS